MKKRLSLFCSMLLVALPLGVQAYQALDYYPASPPANDPATAAVHMWSNSITAWADSYENLQFGTGVTSFMDPAKAMGAAVGGPYDVLCLGRQGQVTMGVSGGIRDGDGPDFAVFENAFSHTYLELAFVEVSSDGTNFVRYPNYSLTPAPVNQVDPTLVIGLAGTFKESYGTPFDLNELRKAYQDAVAGNTDFSAQYTQQLTNGFPLLDLEHITHIRLVDVFGDGASDFDSRGLQIYDPVDVFGVTAGFDLDAVGVLHSSVPVGLPQQIVFDRLPHQKLAFGSMELSATADSGLPVFFDVQSGPAIHSGSELFFTGTGTVEVVASQPGDSSYAPAAPVLRSFRVAEEIQHIFVEPIPNQLQGGGAVQVMAYSSSGLPVHMELYDGPFSASIGETNHWLNLGNETGTVRLRAYQAGSAAVAPANDVFVDFNIVGAGSPDAPVEFSSWMAAHERPEPLVFATNDVYGHPAVGLDFVVDRRMLGRSRVIQSGDLVLWSNAVPEILEWSGGGAEVALRLQFTAEDDACFYRLEFEGQ